jgi:hypothetical protein
MIRLLLIPKGFASKPRVGARLLAPTLGSSGSELFNPIGVTSVFLIEAKACLTGDNPYRVEE